MTPNTGFSGETASRFALPQTIRLVEVGLRDGLQSLSLPVTTDQKVELAELLVDSGVRDIEVVSFAHPKVLPQFADALEVMRRVPRKPDVRYRGLVPNVRGAERAATANLDVTVALACADEAVTQRNQNASVDEVLASLSSIGKIVKDSGSQYVVGIANAFFAWGSGAISKEQRFRCIDAAVDAGAQGIYLACTTGMEDPLQVYEGVNELREQHPAIEVGVHLHARNGMALASALSALQAGADWLEGSFGGLGGDLWAPGLPEVLGNAPYEDLVHMTEVLGIKTGVDLQRYMHVVERVQEITGWAPRSFVKSGGTRAELTREGILEEPVDGK